MSNIVKAVVGVVLIAAGLLTSWAGGEYLIMMGASMLLTAAASALGPKPPRAPPLSGIDVAYSGTLEPRRLIYGMLKVSGMNGIPPMTSGANNDYFHQVLVLAGRPVTGITDVFLNQIRIPTGNIAAVTGSAGDGLVSGIATPPTGVVNGNAYNNKVWLRRYLGTQTTVDFILTTAFTSWNASHKGQGLAYLAMQFLFDQSVFSGGVPPVTAFVKGHAVYDPRLDSTNGGSGSQSYLLPSSWTYSTNPALILRDFLTTALGVGESQTRINDTLVAAAANKCDEALTVPIPVLVGLTNWTSGLANVTGQNTTFLSSLAGGLYVKAPNGTMLLVSSVATDLQFALSAPYGGATIADQVTQYSATTATTTTQPRYTCNTAIDATARFEDNITILAAAMMGYAIYSGGKWCMYAGAWPGTSFVLAEDDLVGGLSMQCTTPRKDLFNAVRGNFIDPQQNYQPAEFPPVLNSAYVAQDGGETIYVETNFPCCSDRFESQRNAIMLSRQSRNRRVVTAQFGMSAYGIRAFEVGTITIAEIGWIAQTVRCTSWKFMPQGVIELTLQEAYSADWTDPLSTDYVVTGINIGPSAGSYLPYPPTGLTATSVAGGINFLITLPNQVLPGTMIELWEYTASTPFSSASLVWFGTATRTTLYKTDVVTRYYWVRTRGPNNLNSPTYPATTGVAGVAMTPADQVWMPWVAFGNCTVADDDVLRPTGPNGWDSGCRSVNGYTTCHISGKQTNTTLETFIGLTTTPFGTPIPLYWNESYSFDIYYGQCSIYESGTSPGYVGSRVASDLLAITYDGTTITYLVNGVSVRTVTAPGLKLYGYCLVYSAGSALNSLHFGPTTNLAVNDTVQIGLNAATSIQISSATGINVPNGGTYTYVVSITVGPYPYTTSVILTASGDWKLITGANVDAPLCNAGAYSGSGGVSNITTFRPASSVPAGTTTIGSFALEQTYTLLPNNTTTYSVMGLCVLFNPATTTYTLGATMKLETIKR